MTRELERYNDEQKAARQGAPVKFRAEREALADAVGTAQRAVASRTGALPVLSGLRVTLGPGSVELVGSDLEMTIRVTTPVQGEGEGSAVLPARLFADILARLDGDIVTVELVGEDARIEAGRFATTLRTLSVGEFPRLPEVPAGGVRVDGAALAESLRQVVPAASRDDARPILTGVLLAANDGGLRLVATDSYRLAMRDLPASVLPDGAQVIIPARSLSELLRLLTLGDTVGIEVTDHDATFHVGNTRLVTRLIQGTYHDYTRLVPPPQPNSVTISREEALEAIRRVKLVARDPIGTPLRIRMANDGITMKIVSQDNGEAFEQLDGELTGNEIEMSFNNEFLAAGIDACQTEFVDIQTSEPGKLAVIRPKDGTDYTYLLMPLRS